MILKLRMMKEKVYIKFDLSNEEMIREAIRMPELYEDMFVYLTKELFFAGYHDRVVPTYENEFMVVSF